MSATRVRRRRWVGGELYIAAARRQRLATDAWQARIFEVTREGELV